MSPLGDNMEPNHSREGSMEAIRFIDGDAHILEPASLWENYLEKKYQPLIESGYVRWSRASSLAGKDAAPMESGVADPMCFELNLKVMGHQLPLGVTDTTAATRGFEGRDLDDLDRAYGKWADQDLPASAYREVMDTCGIDYMILYPTIGFFSTGVREMDGETAAAIRRAYNGWLGDFCKDIGQGACGAASIDLRDPELARKEVERCVKEYDFKAVHLNPAPELDLRVYDEACDPLWATCADLGVPVGLHPSVDHPFDLGLMNYLTRLRNCRTTVSFVMGSMLACTVFIMGGVLERHPKLKLVFLESGCGWPDRLEAGVQGGTRRLKIQGLSYSPVEYFERQCFVAADQDDPGIEDLINAIGDHVIVAATDFGHPEGRKYFRAKQDMIDLQGVSMESKRKLLWDNALRAYPISPD